MDDGTITRDLLAPDQPHPAERHLNPADREAATQRFGQRCLASGVCVLAGAFLGALIAAVVSENSPFDTDAGCLLAVLGLLALVSLGSVLLAFGGAERLHRSQRAMSRYAAARQDLMFDHLAGVEHAIDRIAEYLPDDQEIRHWRGFNDAVRRGVGGQRTGTDGAPSVRRLGIARQTEV